MEQVDEHPGVGLVRGPEHPGGLGEVRRLRPRRKLQVDGQAEGQGQLAQLGESIGLAGEVRIRQLRDDVASPELGAGLQEAQVVARAVSGREPGELDVEDLDAGRREVRLGGPHQCRVVGQGVVRLLGGDLRHPQPHVAIAGGGGGIHQLRRRQAQRGQVGERVLVPVLGRGLGRRARQHAQALTAVRGHAQRNAVGVAEAAVAVDALDHLEEQPRAQHLGEEVQVLALLVAVVEDRVLAQTLDEIGRQRQAGVEVVVVVAGHLEDRHPALTHDLRAGDRVIGGEGDELRARHPGRPIAAPQRGGAQGDAHPIAWVARRPAADECRRER